MFVDGRHRGRELHYYRTQSGRKVDFVWRGGDGRLTLCYGILLDDALRTARFRAGFLFVFAISDG